LILFLNFLLGEEDNMFAEQWFDKYVDKDGSDKEKKIRRNSLMTINFNDSDDEESEILNHVPLGMIKEGSE
jgi:hypothetical protein